MGVRFPKPPSYNCVRRVNGGAAESDANDSLEEKLDQLLSKGKEIIESQSAKKQLNMKKRSITREIT